MTKKKPVLLFITHDASQTGAPTLLLHIIKLLKEKGYTINVLLRKGGSLKENFFEAADLCVLYRRPRSKIIIKKLKYKLFGKITEFNIKPLLKGVDIVLSNTITNSELLLLVKKYFQGPVISYIHELEIVTGICTNEKTLRIALESTNHFLVPCNAVKNFLMHKCGIQEANISLLHYYIPPGFMASKEEVKDYKSNFSINAGFIVGSLGSKHWRKGIDIFILVADIVFKINPSADIQFVWVGGESENLEHKEMLYDIEKLKLENKVIVLQHSTQANLFLKSVDLFLMPSREDPYPLVVLEAASQKIPTICFDKGGGATEFVGMDSGTVVNYLDIYAMANSILNYYNDPILLRKHGENAFNKVQKLHHDKEQIFEEIQNVFKAAMELN